MPTRYQSHHTIDYDVLWCYAIIYMIILSHIYSIVSFPSSFSRYSVDFDLKKVIDESALDAKANRIESKKQVKKIFEEKYKSQTAKSDKKAQGVQYFFNKLRF